MIRAVSFVTQWNANTEVLRLKQVHYIKFIAYFFKYSLKAQNVNFLKTPASENNS